MFTFDSLSLFSVLIIVSVELMVGMIIALSWRNFDSTIRSVLCCFALIIPLMAWMATEDSYRAGWITANTELLPELRAKDQKISLLQRYIDLIDNIPVELIRATRQHQKTAYMAAQLYVSDTTLADQHVWDYAWYRTTGGTPVQK